MRRMWRLERRLKSDRPQPRDEFLSALANRVTPEAPRPQSAWRRPVLVGGLTALLVVAFAATGGIGYAAKSVQGGTSAVASLVTGPSNDSHPNNGNGGGNGKNNGNAGNGNSSNNGSDTVSDPSAQSNACRGGQDDHLPRPARESGQSQHDHGRQQRRGRSSGEPPGRLPRAVRGRRAA